MQKKELRAAFKNTVPIMFSYIFLGTAFGIMLNEAGYGVVYGILCSVFIYTGAFQMALAGFLKAGTAIISIFVTAIAVGSRHIFYGISFIDDFKKMGKRFPYMIFGLTDEAYAIFCADDFPKDLDKASCRFYSAIMIQCYWVFGTILGEILGSTIPFDFKGIDFSMTALFICVLIDQWKSNKDHKPALIGLASSIICLYVFGVDNFILPALLIATAILLLMANSWKKTGKNDAQMGLVNNRAKEEDTCTQQEK